MSEFVDERLIEERTAVDYLEPLTTIDEVRDARVKAIALLNGVMSRMEQAMNSGSMTEARTSLYGIAFGLGLNLVAGESMTERATLIGCTRAALSKVARSICLANDLEPSWHMKSEDASLNYREARLEVVKESGKAA